MCADTTVFKNKCAQKEGIVRVNISERTAFAVKPELSLPLSTHIKSAGYSAICSGDGAA